MIRSVRWSLSLPSCIERHFLSFDRHGHRAARFCRTRPFFERLTYPNARNILHRVEKNAKLERNINGVEHFASRLDVGQYGSNAAKHGSAFERVSGI